MITVPEYYKKYIDPTVDLNVNPKQCCPMHQENTPSFSYDSRTGRWRCFGACHCGGDVFELHRRFKKIRTREQAKRDLCNKEGIPLKDVLEEERDFRQRQANFEDINLLIQKCNLAARTPEDYIELDQIMTYYPIDRNKLNTFLSKKQ